MAVLNDICGKCNYACKTIYFQRNFDNWTSGNNEIDKFIQDTQLSAHSQLDLAEALEWIPYDRFYDIKCIAKGELGKMYKANWIDGYIRYWNNQNWKRYDSNMFVILKSLNDPNDVISEFMMNKVP